MLGVFEHRRLCPFLEGGANGISRDCRRKLAPSLFEERRTARAEMGRASRTQTAASTVMDVEGI